MDMMSEVATREHYVTEFHREGVFVFKNIFTEMDLQIGSYTVL